MANYNIPIIDASAEVSTARLRVSDAISDVNLTALFDAVDGVIVGNPGVSTLNVSTPKDQGSGVKSSDKTAQRELKWLVTVVDAVTGEKYRFEIPCPDMSILGDDGSTMVTSSGTGAALLSAVQAHVLSKVGNAVTVSTIRLVGRNN